MSICMNTGVSRHSGDGPFVIIFLCFFLFVVNGGYSKYKKVGECTKTWGGGMETLKRTCTNPPPSYGGKNCTGEDSYTRECNNMLC